jgi:flagellin
MRINTNVGALTASKNVFVNNTAAEASMRKLSSGLRISRAGDDAAGLAIANTLRTQSRSLAQAAANAEQGAAMLQIAESAAQTIQRIIERQKELVIQRDNATQDTVTQGYIDDELGALDDEVARIVDAANYGTTNVFASLSFVVDDTGDAFDVDASFSASTVSDVSSADDALEAINNALAAIGAGQNRLDYTVQNLKAAVVNLRAAESTIRDVDMAEEMANFTKNSVLAQAATSMLAQANQSSQSILQLLR